MDEVEDKIHVAPHPEGPRAPPPSVDPLHGHTYLDFTPSIDATRFCEKLTRMHVGSHAGVDWMHRRPLVRRLDSISAFLWILHGIVYLS
ncbi:hypothetical protein Hanom_Chr10g00942791 [Helianthus anomalus]